MNKKVLSLIMAVTLLLPAVCFADGHQRLSLEEKYFSTIFFLLQHKEELQLTEEQIQSIKDRKFDLMRQDIQSDAQLALIGLDMKKELHSVSPKLDQLETLVDNKTEVIRTLDKLYVRAIVDTQTLLTPEQRDTAKELFWKEFYGSGSSH